MRCDYSGILLSGITGTVTRKAPQKVTGNDKVREIRLRRTAERRGHRLERCRRRDPWAVGYGKYRLCPGPYTLTLDDVETALSAPPAAVAS
jgi:hypothetical protein